MNEWTPEPLFQVALVDAAGRNCGYIGYRFHIHGAKAACYSWNCQPERGLTAVVVPVVEQEQEHSKAIVTAHVEVQVDPAWMAANASELGYVQASDNVWVPAAELAAYERGRRVGDMLPDPMACTPAETVRRLRSATPPGLRPARPKDAEGNPIEPGRYSIQRGGEIRSGTVSEDELTDLWILFDGQERPQRVDELTRYCTWQRATEPTQTA